MRRRAVALLVTGVAGVVLVGCGGGGVRTVQASPSRNSLSVPLIGHRDHNAVAAFVGVTLAGHLYYLLVDTGAASTIIDTRVARKLGLRDKGSPREFASLGCKVLAQPVALLRWRLGDVTLPATTVFTQRLLTPGAP